MNDIRDRWLTPRRGLVWLLPAAAALALSNGRWQLAFAAVAARAIENGVTLVRPTYAGLSVVADPYGRMVAQSDDLTLTERSLVTRVPIYLLPTIYPALAGFLPPLAGLALVGLIVMALRKRRT
jgi:apolipoprotein N-acyltransferase